MRIIMHLLGMLPRTALRDLGTSLYQSFSISWFLAIYMLFSSLCVFMITIVRNGLTKLAPEPLWRSALLASYILIGIPVADLPAGPTMTTGGFVSDDLEDDRITLFLRSEKLGSL